MTNGGPQNPGASSTHVVISSVDLPDKKYFKIGEVAELIGVEPHVLRYWQTQFPQVKPQKSRSGHRLYRRRDVESLLTIRDLLHVQRFTIAGARQALKGSVPPSAAPKADPPKPLNLTTTQSDRTVHAFRAITEQTTLQDWELAAEAPKPPSARHPHPAPTSSSAQMGIERPAVLEEQVEVEVVGLEADELSSAMASQWASASQHEHVELDVHPEDPARGENARREQEAGAGLADVAGDFRRAVPGLKEPAGARTPRGVRALDTGGAPAPSSGDARRAKLRGEQLGFGFLPSAKTALEDARAEVVAILAALAREDAESRRRVGATPPPAVKATASVKANET